MPANKKNNWKLKEKFNENKSYFTQNDAMSAAVG